MGRADRWSGGYPECLVEQTTELIAAEAIAARVGEMAAQIDEDYADCGELVLVGVLKGSFIFLADLARRLTIPHRVEFISVSSYGDRESDEAGAVRLIMDVRHAILDKHVLVVEDIVDTGHTLSYLMRLLQARGPASLRACTLLHKPERSEVEVKLEYIGFTIPDEWVVGYGLDFAERHRTLPNLCVIEDGRTARSGRWSLATPHPPKEAEDMRRILPILTIVTILLAGVAGPAAAQPTTRRCTASSSTRRPAAIATPSSTNHLPAIFEEHGGALDAGFHADVGRSRPFTLLSNGTLAVADGERLHRRGRRSLRRGHLRFPDPRRAAGRAPAW